MKTSITFLLVLLITSFQASAQNHYYAVDYIHGEGEVDGIKIAYQYAIDDYLPETWPVSVVMETSMNFWEYGEHDKHDSNVVLAISPIVRYPFAQVGQYPLEAELGIGVSLINDTHFAGKDVSTHYQFEDRIGVSTHWGPNKKYRIALRYLHYSNAGFKKPNPGLDFISLSFSQRI